MKKKTKKKYDEPLQNGNRRYKPDPFDKYAEEIAYLNTLQIRLSLARECADLKAESGERFYNDEWIKSNILKL